MERYNGVVQDTNGNAINSASITVTDSNGNPVTVYSNSTGTAQIIQPFTPATQGSSLGEYYFYAADGKYRIAATYGGVTYYEYDINLFDNSATTGAASVGANDGSGGSLYTTVDGFMTYSKGGSFVASALSTADQAATPKTTAVDADLIPLFDSAASFVLKKFTWANLKATAKTYFDTLYAVLNSPAFTGTPTAPTPGAGDNSTNIATTAFVQTALSNIAQDAKLQSVSASVNLNALTVGLNPTSLDFRSTTLGTGTPTTVTNSVALSLAVPSGATLGTVNNVLARLVLLAINNAGTMELAIVNEAGGVNLDETTLINTTAISGTSNSNNVIYSTNARTGVPFRVVGYVEATEATAGTWATAPSLVQGIGGQAGAAMQSIGNGQTWQDVTASRASSTTYYNTTGRPILVSIISSAGNPTTTVSLAVNGMKVDEYSVSGTGVTSVVSVKAIVPSGGSYVLTGSAATWIELR